MNTSEAETPSNHMVGTKIAKYFEVEDFETLFRGSVQKCFPAEECEGNVALYLVKYEDNDIETMELEELLTHQKLYKKFYQQNTHSSRRVTLSPTHSSSLFSPEVAQRDTKTTPPSVMDVATKDSPMKTNDTTHDESESESDDEEEESLIVTGKRKRKALDHYGYNDNNDNDDEDTDPPNKSRKKLDQYDQDDDFNDIDDDDDEPLAFDESIQVELLHAGPSLRPCLDLKEQLDVLQKIPVPENAALQKLLFNEGFRFTLLEHQFLAVRAVAGLPETFPLHPGSSVKHPHAATMAQALEGLDRDNNQREGKGVLIADEMGLGKTVEAIAGAILRIALTRARKQPALPTVIVSPNDAVQVQWRDTLYQNGVPKKNICHFKKGQEHVKPGAFLLLTRHKLQAEVKRVFSGLMDNRESPKSVGRSVLFPLVDKDNLERLRVQYEFEHSDVPVPNKYKQKGESTSDCVTRLMGLCGRRSSKKNAKPVFETLIIDEAHFLKNLTTYWAMGAALLGVHSSRRIPITGTPYNNDIRDLATVMTFIDPNKTAARRGFWEDATNRRVGGAIVNKIEQWHRAYLVRRRKDVLTNLPSKIVKSQIVSQYAVEMKVYNGYESMLQECLKQFAELLWDMDNPVARIEMKSLFTRMMCWLSMMRMSNIHAMLPGGREFTKQFSPTRQGLLTIEARPKQCVCCSLSSRPSIPTQENDDVQARARKKWKRRGRNAMEDLADGEPFDDDEDELEEEEEEPLIPIPTYYCMAHSGVPHYAHEACINKLRAQNGRCPRCQHARGVMQLQLPGGVGKQYCKEVNGGFVGSSKIDAAVSYITKEVPENDKVLVLSFFKGGLDLLEGIFHYDLGIDCARFDGDLPRDVSQEELDRFKVDPDCKVLLATVQSGGTGLNIVEANHVLFLDRFYNPFTHAQGEDRCHRIRQEKDVFVTYFDCASTVDEAMAELNRQKQDNSKILLADVLGGLGNGQQGLSYRDLSGMLGSLISTISTFRTAWLAAEPGNQDKPIPPIPESMIKNAVAGKRARLSDVERAIQGDSSTCTNPSDSTGSTPGALKEETVQKSNKKKPLNNKNNFKAATGLEDFIVLSDDEEYEF